MSFILSLIIIFSQNLFLSANAASFPATGLKKLTVAVPLGRISLSTSKTQKDVSVSLQATGATKNQDPKRKCIETIELQDSNLIVKVASENVLFEKAKCEYSATVIVPASLALELDISTGNATVDVRDINGAMNIATATGNVYVSTDVLKDINVKSGTAVLDFKFKTCSGRADVDLITATGNSVIELPENCKIRVDFSSAAGKLFNGIGEAEDYQVKIKAKTASGDLRVVKARK